jgi:hypothetical protein
MKSTIRAFALRFAATAALFAPAAAAQTPGMGQSFCQDWGGGRACETRYYHPSPPPPPKAQEPESPAKHTPVVNDFVPYDAAAEAQKAQAQSVEHRVPASSSLCPPPYRMTAQDGCQR